MIVVLDTNIWRSSLYLKAGAAAAMRFYLHQKGAKVGLPEVIRLPS
jgi:predicted nucleic acid-binding protein